jgi:chromate transporter
MPNGELLGTGLGALSKAEAWPSRSGRPRHARSHRQPTDARFQQLPAITALLFGLKAAVLAIVFEAVIRIGRRALKNEFLFAIAGIAFIAIFAFDVPFPAIILGAALLGALTYRLGPHLFAQSQSTSSTPVAADNVVDRLFESNQLTHAQPNTGRSLQLPPQGSG